MYVHLDLRLSVRAGSSSKLGPNAGTKFGGRAGAMVGLWLGLRLGLFFVFVFWSAGHPSK